jgi:very-short-patch-repair endonuclease
MTRRRCAMDTARDSRTTVVESVTARGGIVRSIELVRRGTPEHLIRAAVSAGELVRLRRRWVAVPDADPYLVAAAREGVVISCVTRARRLDCWTLYSGPPHVAAAPTAGRVKLATAHVHRAAPVVPRPPDALEDGIENMLDLVARCQAEEVALAVVESALRRELVSRAALERLPISAALRDLLAAASSYSDSGLETIVPRRLAWLNVRILQQIWIAGHRLDFLIGERLALQIDGGHHVGPQREADIRHDAELMLRGFHVIRVGYHVVIDDWPFVQNLVMQAVAQGLHRAPR